MMMLELITFPGSGLLPIWIADEKGFFHDPEIALLLMAAIQSFL